MNNNKIITDLRFLDSFGRVYNMVFDKKYKYCTVDDSIPCRAMKEYKGHIYRLKYFDGCFYPYLVQVS